MTATLFDRLVGEDRDHRRAAEAWMAEHPKAYELFKRFALQMAAKGHRFGIGALTERVRWECALEYDDHEFKINNNHRAYIIRRLIREHPELEPFVELRKTNW